MDALPIENGDIPASYLTWCPNCMPHRNYGSIGFSPCRMPEGEEIDAVTGAAVEKPTPELEELRELDEFFWFGIRIDFVFLFL